MRKDRELELSSLENEKAPGRPSSSPSVFTGHYKKDGDRVFSRLCCDRRKGNGFKIKEDRLRLDIKNEFFTMRVVKHRHRSPREVVGAPSLKTFKIRLYGALSNLT